MPLDLTDDLASFFAADEFGEAITYAGVGEISAIWDRPFDDVELGGGRVPVATNVFHIPVTFVPQPRAGAAITVVRTGELFHVAGEPRLNRDGTIWACEADPL